MAQLLRGVLATRASLHTSVRVPSITTRKSLLPQFHDLKSLPKLQLNATPIQTRTFFSIPFFKKNDIKQLEEKADANPSDPLSQAQLMAELNNQKEFDKVVSRYSSGTFAMDEEGKKEYIKAMSALGRVDELLIASSPTQAIKVPVQIHNSKGEPVFLKIQIAKSYWDYLARGLGLLAVLGLGYLIYNSDRSSGSNMSFAVSNAHSEVWKVDTKFADVKGADEAKQELADIVEYLRDPQKFSRLGARLPKGVMLFGAPGTGKTLLARALAGEAGVPFLYVTGSSFDELFVGVGPKRIRTLFEDAKRLAPCIIFIDEIDSVGASRKYNMTSSSKESTLNQLLTEMDGFKSTQGVVVIGATNFAEALDPALLRPGRFDKLVNVPLPDVKGRKEILDLYLKKTIPDPALDSSLIARGTPGFSGADLANLINIAAIKATLRGSPHIDRRLIEEAKDEVIMGIKRSNGEQDEQTRKIIAYHEGGHALVALYTDGAHPLHKATIIQRGSALGMTVQLPEKDEVLATKKQLLARMAVSMGGRAAEEMIFGAEEVTSGASNDFQQASSIAQEMITRLGMSPTVGLRSYDTKTMSDDERRLIDKEVKDMLNQSYSRAQVVLKKHETELHRLAEALLKYETLSVEEIRLIIAGKPIQRDL